MALVATRIVILFVISALQYTNGQQVLGCAGFVRSDFPVDFTKVHVGLFTEHGGQRDMTDCAPSNGYFFVPVEHPAKYSLRVIPPPGWHVTPMEKVIDIDGSSDSCSLNQDIIFQFSGFSVSGQVSSKDKEAGPTGIAVDLLASSGLKVQTVSSDEKGNFVFVGVKPGDYKVRLSEQSLESFSFETKERHVKVVDDRVKIQPFVIIGYDMEGSVLDNLDMGVDKVQVELWQGQNKLKSVSSDESGKFRFANVSRGSYEVRPAKANAMVTLKPEKIVTEVFDKNVFIEKFVMESFLVSGSVRTKTMPLSGVTVTGKQGNSVQTATSDQQGNYNLKAINKGKMTISFALDKVQFDDLDINVRPSLVIPAVSPVRFLFSGQAEVGDPKSKLSVELKNVKTSQVVVENLSNGKFHFFLPVGDYKVQMKSSENEEVETYFPAQTDVKVDGVNPTSYIQFKLARFSVGGKVDCIQKACEGIAVVLRSDNDDIDPRRESVSGNKFKFDDVRQGSYDIVVEDLNKNCWSEKDKSLKVKSDITNLVFKQSGSSVNINTDRSTKLTLTSNSNQNDKHDFDLVEGDNRLCVQGSGEYTLATPQGACYGFEFSPRTVNLGRDSSVSLIAVEFKISGVIKSSNAIPDLKVTASSDQRGEEKLKVLKTDTGYAFKLIASKSESLILKPTSKISFFDPPLSVVQVTGRCEKDFVTFKAREGVFIQGTLVPPVAGANVKVTDENGVVIKAVTEKDGTFKLGPFEDEQLKERKIEVSKEGYHFEETDTYGEFSSRQLSSITVAVKDESGNILPDDAVISISGGSNNFRSNEKTKSGIVRFISLQPGEYFIKAFLKEWVFEPRNIIVKLEENKHEEKVMTAKRIAFSALGKLTYLNGNPASNVVVLGRGIGEACLGKIEDSTTGSDGTFRLRGLEPGCDYEIDSGSKEIQSFITRVNKLQVKNEDVKLSAPIIAQTKPEVFHMTVKIKSSSNLSKKRKTIPVIVSTENDSVPVKSFNVVPNELTTLPAFNVIDDDYIVKVDGKNMKRISKNNAEFHFISADLNEELIASKKESNSKFFMVVPVTLIGLVGFVMHRTYMQKKEV